MIKLNSEQLNTSQVRNSVIALVIIWVITKKANIDAIFFLIGNLHWITTEMTL